MPSIPGLEVFPDRQSLMAAVADAIAQALRQACERRGGACAALSGGVTPVPAYAQLDAKRLDWTRITFLLVDERCVPLDHPASNEAMLRRTLASALAGGAQLRPMYAAPQAPADAAANADKAYSSAAIDIAVMGMGSDTHTASWFPGAAGLADALAPDSARTVAAVHAATGAFGTPDRLTLTRAALRRAGQILLLITGEEKRQTLEQAIGQNPQDAPVAALFEGGPPPAVFWAA